jgi:PAS domain S-box-containing protein
MDGPIRVLYVAPAEAGAESAVAALERENARLAAETLHSAGACLDRLAGADCVVAEYDLPDTDGIDLLEAVREAQPDLPFVLVTDDGGETIAAEAVAADVTEYVPGGRDRHGALAERVRAAVRPPEAAAPDPESLLRTLSELDDRVTWVFSPDWQELLFVNDAYEDVWGRPVADLEADPADFLRGIHPDDRETVRANMQRLSNGETVEVEYRVNADEGFGRWVEVRGVPMVDADEDVVAVAGFARDITETKERKLELQRVRERMEFALDATDAIVWDWNTEADETSFYPTEEDLYGTTVETYEDFMALLHPEDREEARASIEQSLETGETKHEELRIVADGELRWIQAPGRPIDNEGEPTRMVGVAQDITDRKERERELRRLRALLARTFRHNLRNELTVIREFVSLLADDLDGRSLGHLDRVLDSVDTLHQQSQKAQLIARLTGRETERTDHELSTTVEEITGNIRETFPEVDVTLEAPESCRVRATTYLRIALENLVENAAKHNDAADPWVSVTVVADNPVSVRIADNGPPIPDQEVVSLERIEERPLEHGTGIGLGLADLIITQSDGDLDITETDDGNLVRVSLPRAG